jgi:hypothetical protein
MTDGWYPLSVALIYRVSEAWGTWKGEVSRVPTGCYLSASPLKIGEIGNVETSALNHLPLRNGPEGGTLHFSRDRCFRSQTVMYMYILKNFHGTNTYFFFCYFFLFPLKLGWGGEDLT